LTRPEISAIKPAVPERPEAPSGLKRGPPQMKTFSARPGDIDKKWVLIDAEGIVLGRLASLVAKMLRGKHKATFTPHMDMGDNVIVINAEKVQMTGNKRADKRYYWHTG
jgi:large subunit ribosomal protein L13